MLQKRISNAEDITHHPTHAYGNKPVLLHCYFVDIITALMNYRAVQYAYTYYSYSN